MDRIILSSADCLAVQYFSTLSYMWYDFRKIKGFIEGKNVCFNFSTFLSQTFVILRRIQQDIIIIVHRS